VCWLVCGRISNNSRLRRKPAELVAVAGVKPGDKVIELDPGPLYFTQILSNVVGPKGQVYAYIPSDLDELYKKDNIVVPPPPEPRYRNVTFVYEPADDHSKRVFDSSIRGVTDQFIFKFQKPGGRNR
jgi:predicted methyltransferase